VTINVNKAEYENAFNVLKQFNTEQCIVCTDEQIHKVMELMGFKICTYSDGEVLGGLLDEIRTIGL
jgi:hypothetical protein